MRRSTIVSSAAMCKLLVWACVAVWCAVPLAWSLFMAGGGSNEQKAANVNEKKAVQKNEPPQTGPQTLAAKIAASAMMIAAFGYAAWCACGVVCGFGVDRVISIVENAIIVSNERNPQQPTQNPFI